MKNEELLVEVQEKLVQILEAKEAALDELVQTSYVWTTNSNSKTY